jgi:hypothetical protein
MTSFINLLLLDLDGVVVFECGPPLLKSLEILKLHEDMPALIAAVGVPVVVLTHRSRAEALHILQSVGLAPSSLAGLAAAEDLFSAGLRLANWRALLGRGLRKSLILPVIEGKFGVPRSRIAFIDDRLDNLDDLLDEGLGLALHAPSDVQDNQLITYDFHEAVARIRDWQGDQAKGGLVKLSPVALPVQQWRYTGLNTRSRSRHPFNIMRATVRNIRQRLA